MNKFNTNIVAKVDVPGVAYITDIIVAAPNGSLISSIYLLNLTSGLWMRNLTWTPLSLGLSFICAIAYDNFNQTGGQSCFSLSVDTKKSYPPYLMSYTAYPIGNASSDFLIGNNGFMTFKINFNVVVQRPTQSAFIRIYNSNNTQVLAYDCRNSGFVYYIDSYLYFDVYVNTFQPDWYYVTFDQGVGVGYGYCSWLSPAVLNSTFWNFTVLSYQIDNLINTNQSYIHNCLSNIVDAKNLTNCNSSSFILLLFSFLFPFLIIHVFLLLSYLKHLNLKLKTVPSKVYPVYIPSNSENRISYLPS